MSLRISPLRAQRKMKITFSAALILSAAIAFAGVAAAPCNIAALSKLLVTGNVRTCQAESGYNPTSMAMPTDAQVTAVCSSNACKQSINAVKEVAPDECTIGPIHLYANVINPLSQRCGISSGSAGAAGSAGVSGSVRASGSGSGPSVGDVGSLSSSGSIPGSATKPPVTSTPLPTTRPSSGSPSPTSAPGNGGAGVPTLSMCAAIAALATVVAAIL